MHAPVGLGVQPPFPGPGPSISNLAPRNPQFTGRADLLDELGVRLTGEGAAVAVHGPGGVGKSELALEYAWLAGEQAAVDLLRLCAFLGPGPIPPSLLAADPEVLPPELAVAVCNKQALEATIAALYRLSLVGRDHDGLRLHRLVGGVVRDGLTTNPGGPRQRSTWWLPVFQPMSPSRPAGRRVPGCCATRWPRRTTPTGWA